MDKSKKRSIIKSNRSTKSNRTLKTRLTSSVLTSLSNSPRIPRSVRSLFSVNTKSKVTPKSEIISSFAAAFNRNWIRKKQDEWNLKKQEEWIRIEREDSNKKKQEKQKEWIRNNPPYYLYELSYDENKLHIFDVNGDELSTLPEKSMSSMKNEKKRDTPFNEAIKHLKTKNSFIILKVRSNAPPDHYGNHWYFNTPDSIIDTSDQLSTNGWVPKSKPKTGLMYTNSYTLDWQFVATNQFCMIYALYGVIVPKDVQKTTLYSVNNDEMIDADRIQQIYTNGENLYDGIDYANQDKNTSTILTFLKNVIQACLNSSDYQLVMKSVTEGSSAYKKKHNKSYSLNNVMEQIQNGIENPEFHRPLWW